MCCCGWLWWLALVVIAHVTYGCVSPARVLKRRMAERERTDNIQRTRWQRAAPGGVPGGNSWLAGARREDLEGGVTPFEDGVLTALELEGMKDPAGSFSYLPAVSRDHHTVHVDFHHDLTCPGAGWIVALMVRRF
jgi:hypothetical protein